MHKALNRRLCPGARALRASSLASAGKAAGSPTSRTSVLALWVLLPRSRRPHAHVHFALPGRVLEARSPELVSG